MSLTFPEWVPPNPASSTSNDLVDAREALAAARGTSIPLIYGAAIVEASVFIYEVGLGGRMILGAAWGMGELEAIGEIYIEDVAISTLWSGVPGDNDWIYENFRGTPTQGVPPDLVAEWAAKVPPQVYNDNLRGTYQGHPVSIAYSIIRVPANEDLPNKVTAVVSGRKLDDLGSTAPPEARDRERAARILADFLTDPVSGLGAKIDVPSFRALDDFCRGTEPVQHHRACSLVLDTRSPIDQWIQTLREYAACYLAQEGDVIYATPDTVVPDADISMDITPDDIVEGSWTVEQIGTKDIPTVVSVEYTDSTVFPWRRNMVTVTHPDVDAGILEHREAVIPLPGVIYRREALDRAIEKLNKYNLIHMQCRFTMFDKGIYLRIGDVVKLYHPIGIIGKRMRVIETNMSSIGRWDVLLEEYDPLVYDTSAIQIDPTWTDTDVRPHGDPPLPKKLQAVADDIVGGKEIRIWWDFDDSRYYYPYLFNVDYDFVSSIDGQRVQGTVQSEQGMNQVIIPAPGFKTLATGDVTIKLESTWFGNTVQGNPLTDSIVLL